MRGDSWDYHLSTRHKTQGKVQDALIPKHITRENEFISAITGLSHLPHVGFNIGEDILDWTCTENRRIYLRLSHLPTD